MKIVTDINEANELLGIYSGSSLQIAMYSTSLKRMALKLVLPNSSDILYLVAIGCEYMEGNFFYPSSSVHIHEEGILMNERTTVIIDANSKFKLISSGGFSLALGKEVEFGSSFENFILDK